MKKILILKEHDTKLTIHPKYLDIRTLKGSYIVAFSHIKMIYLNKAISIDLKSCYALCCKIPLFIIDQNGYIIAEFKRLDKEEG